MYSNLLIFFLVITAIIGAPTSSKILYDQRQEGDWNVHADFKNIVVMVIPKTSTSFSPNVGTLLDYLVRSIPGKHQFKRLNKPQRNEVPGEETSHFIESKTAPYHVDISKSHLAKLHPEVGPQMIEAEEIVIAKSPSVELVKERSVRDVKKKESKLKLLGAEYEQCGPGLVRDAEGICRIVKLHFK